LFKYLNYVFSACTLSARLYDAALNMKLFITKDFFLTRSLSCTLSLLILSARRFMSPRTNIDNGGRLRSASPIFIKARPSIRWVTVSNSTYCSKPLSCNHNATSAAVQSATVFPRSLWACPFVCACYNKVLIRYEHINM